ncbi:MAG: protein-L-isoaspartate(D-aspartate) O-methyltransferase [Gammaproteobacteria bacterium]
MDKRVDDEISLSLRGRGMTSQRTRNRLVSRLRAQGIKNMAVLDVMRRVPRHIFVDEALASRAYEEMALPIGHRQTISQPFIVARMTEYLMQESRLNSVLEVGTGSGYQTAILAQLVDRVFSVERIAALLDRARVRLQTLELANVRTRHADGRAGWVEHAPYDGILVAAAPLEVPAALLEQLAVGGRLVIPLGRGPRQRLSVITRGAAGYEEERVDYVRFVPMLGGMG